MKKRILKIVTSIIIVATLLFVAEIIVFHASFQKPVKSELKERVSYKR